MTEEACSAVSFSVQNQLFLDILSFLSYYNLFKLWQISQYALSFKSSRCVITVLEQSKMKGKVDITKYSRSNHSNPMVKRRALVFMFYLMFMRDTWFHFKHHFHSMWNNLIPIATETAFRNLLSFDMTYTDCIFTKTNIALNYYFMKTIAWTIDRRFSPKYIPVWLQ